MNELTITEFKNIRVLTTQQLAESYGTDAKIISYNFNNNKERYLQDKHYILLQDEELRAFREIHDLPTNINKLYLWTEKGALLHAKSLNTDMAWEVYDKLVDTYFQIKESKPIDTLDALIQGLQLTKALQEQIATQKVQIDSVSERVESIREVVALDTTSWREDTGNLLKKIGFSLGGGQQYSLIREESYKLFEKRMGYDLKIRLTNRKKTMALEGASKTRINNTSYLDIIESEKRMVECYVAIVKEMAIKYGVA